MTTAHDSEAPGPQWPGAQRAYRGRAVDEPSNGEIMRRVDDFAQSVREDMTEIRNAHAAFVLREVYEARHTALTAKVQALEIQRDRDAAERRNDRRWVVGSIVIPVVILLYTVISNIQGVSGA